MFRKNAYECYACFSNRGKGEVLLMLFEFLTISGWDVTQGGIG